MSRRRPGRLPHWQEWTVYVSFGMLIATGIAWLLLEHFVRIAGEFGPEPHPAQRWTLVAHGLVAYGFLIVAGTMVPVHIIAGWNTRRNLKSGLTFAGTLLLLAVTALGLYYLGDDSVRGQVSLIHWVAGLVALPLLLIHALKGRGNR
jgi:hypothetical protein